MATQLDDALSAAALNDTERCAVARIVARLEAELGEDLPYYSMHMHELEWLIDRRRIRSFFFQEYRESPLRGDDRPGARPRGAAMV